MSTLLLRLSGPMQSWGTDSRFDLRFTGREPSKSGIVGLLCAALGKPREERLDNGLPALAELAALRMGVRVERPGLVRVDFQTAGGTRNQEDRSRFGIISARGAVLANPVISQRYYLADADFLVGLAGDNALLRRLDAALAAPVWQLFLGRKSYVPGEPVRLPDAGPDSRWWEMGLEEALRPGAGGYPRAERQEREQRPIDRLRLVLEAPAGPNTETRQDVPLDFATRRFGLRYVQTAWISPEEESDVPLAPDA
ncbi:MAG: type I-E CRISPR-associated protein Cas5/CasD [Dehalococcoidia bacterium]